MSLERPQVQAFFRKIGSGLSDYLTELLNRFSQASNLMKQDAKFLHHCSVKKLSHQTPTKGVSSFIIRV